MREIEARLKISALDKTGGVFGNIAGKMARVSRQAEEFNRRNTLFARRQVADFDRINTLYTKTLAAVSTAYVAKEAYADFAARERSLTRIAITADATDEQLQTVRDTIARLSKELAMSPDDAVEGLDTLVASGKSLEEAMAFLPNVMKAAQATGAKVSEMATTAEKSSSALKIPVDELNRSFDLMIELGKAGQFEAKDMASYIPGLANSWASLGYKGNDGLMKLGANLQTIREDTADASSAATQLGDILGKMYGDETSNKFKKMGVPNLRKELDEARKAGEGVLEAFIRISERTLKGDYSKLPMLFGDKEMRLGMQSLLTSQESYRRYLAVGTDPKVAGATDRDVKRVTQDAKAPIDRMMASLDRTVQVVGKALEKPVTALLDSVSEQTDKESAALRGFEKMGHMGGAAWWKLLNNMPIGTFPGTEAYERAARRGGYVPADRPDLKTVQKTAPFAYDILGRLPIRPISKTPEKFALPDVFTQKNPLESFIDRQDFDARRRSLQATKDRLEPLYEPMANPLDFKANAASWLGGKPRSAAPDGRHELDALDARRSVLQQRKDGDHSAGFTSALNDMSALSRALDEGGQKIAGGGDEAAKALVEAGRQFASLITASASQAAQALSSIKVKVEGQNSAKANLGDTSKFAKNPMGPR